MSEFLITCTRKSERTAAGHKHITSVGIGGKRYAVERIYRAIDAGDTFHTVSPSTGREVPVGKFHCCGIDTLRSYADRQWDDNLDSLPKCP
jgi:hypothetical protein